VRRRSASRRNRESHVVDSALRQMPAVKVSMRYSGVRNGAARRRLLPTRRVRQVQVLRLCRKRSACAATAMVRKGRRFESGRGLESTCKSGNSCLRGDHFRRREGATHPGAARRLGSTGSAVTSAAGTEVVHGEGLGRRLERPSSAAPARAPTLHPQRLSQPLAVAARQEYDPCAASRGGRTRRRSTNRRLRCRQRSWPRGLSLRKYVEVEARHLRVRVGAVYPCRSGGAGTEGVMSPCD
jgi:hypothetical protein